ncbi:MAG TPA: ATP-binding protein, partial [Gammaproteobacteria bacterium]
VSLPKEPLTLEADPMRLAQVFSNLLNNAAKYTDEGGRIWLTARQEKNWVIVSVRDTGVGIAPDMQPYIFDMFTQVNRNGRSQGGLGIGLTLARSMVEMHGGSIEARSEGAGRGSEFIVRLPLTPGLSSNVEKQRPDLPDAPSPRSILVVDDNHDAADSLRLLLQFLGNKVYVAHDGPSALHAVEIYRPSVVLLDLGMPGMDGYEVARRIRQQSQFNNITLIALTGWGQEEDRQRTQAEGFNQHLIKPVDINTLQALLVSL